MLRGLARRPPRPTLSALETVAAVSTELLLIALAGFVGVSVLLVLGVLAVPDPESNPWVGIIGGPILMGTAALTYWLIERGLARPGDPVEALVPATDRMPWPSTLGVVAVHIAAAVLGSAVLGLIQEYAFAKPEEQQTILDLVATGDPALLMLLAVVAVVAAPVTEEALFRGLFFRRLMNRASVTAAWVLPAWVFAAAHWNPIGLVIYVWLALVFAHAYARTGRLGAAMLTHAGANAITLALLVFGPELDADPSAAEPTTSAAETADVGVPASDPLGLRSPTAPAMPATPEHP